MLEGQLAPLSAQVLIHHRSELLDHPRCGRALRFYALLTETPELLEGVSAERIFWSRYYWFLVFAGLHEAAEGFDAGVQQQAFELLAEAEARGHDPSFAESVAELAARAVKP